MDWRIKSDGKAFFPVDLDVNSGCFYFLETSLSELRKSTFLDNRFFQEFTDFKKLDAEDIPVEFHTPINPFGYLFHTSFCCSTLLARLLDFPDKSLVLKEPFVLRRLSDARYAGNYKNKLTEIALGLLSRSPENEPAILLKPTHVALNIADEVMSASPNSRAILITSTLNDFLISNIKKPDSTKQKVPELVERFMSASNLPNHLPPEAFEPPDFLCGVALQWHAQKKIINDLQNSIHGHNINLVNESDLLKSPEQTLTQCLQWLQWSMSEKEISKQIKVTMSHHSKSSGREYSPVEKEHETRLLLQKYNKEISFALKWSDKYLGTAG